MCRWLAYQGEPTFLDVLVAEPAHSLIAQSLCASEAKVVTNGDGFGVGWYGDRDVRASTARCGPPGRTRTSATSATRCGPRCFSRMFGPRPGRRSRAPIAIPLRLAV